MSKILRRPVVQAKSGLPRSTMYWLMSLNQFPKPIKLGARMVGWVEEEIDEWIASRIKESRQVAV